MSTELEALKKQVSDVVSGFNLLKKETDLKLDAAQQDVQQYKEIAAKAQSDLKAFQEKTEADKKALALAQAAAKEKADLEYFQEQLKAGKLKPAQKEAFIAFLATLSSAAEVYTFSEKDGSKRSHTQLSLFKELFAIMPATVPSRGQEFSTSQRPAVILPVSQNVNGVTDPEEDHFIEVKDFGEKKTKQYPAVGIDFSAQIFEYQEEQRKMGRTIDYGTAMVELSAKTKSDTRIPR